MPTGHVKVFHQQRNYGFLVTEDGVDLYVHADAVSDGALHSGDEVTFEVDEGEHGSRAAVDVNVTKRAPTDNPVGRTMSPPPTWDELEQLDRKRRSSRRRRR